MLLMTEGEARDEVRRLIDDREWWVIPWVGEHAGGLCQEVERRFYDGDDSADFSLVLLGPDAGVLSVAFAHKRRMSAVALASLMAEFGVGQDVDALAAMLEAQDILIAVGENSDGSEVLRALAWHRWVTEKNGQNPHTD